MLNVFLCANIPCQVIEDEEKTAHRHVVRSIFTEQKIVCDSAVESLFQNLMEQSVCNKNIVAALIRDTGWSCGSRITLSKFFDYLSNRISVLNYLLTEKEYNRLVSFIENWKECDHGEKEAV